jgi:glucose-1-phosphate adenylyltransferase
MEFITMERVLAIVMAGGSGERLQPLTRGRSKAAVPFGGKFRLIDFTLSNCVNSGLRHIFVLTQYRSGSLNRHIQDGWGISTAGLGDFIYCIPAQQKLGQEWYQGTADAVRQNLNLIRAEDFEDVLILSGDHIYKMDYRQFLTYHSTTRASLTIAAIREKKERAAGVLGVLEIDSGNRLIGFEEKPAQPKAMPGAPGWALASMGVYAFKVETLIEALKGQENDFGERVIPKMLGRNQNIFVYDYQKENRIADFRIEVNNGIREKLPVEKTRDSSYWKDVGTIDSYYEASMELLDVDPLFNLYGERWPLRTNCRSLPPTKCILGGRSLESMVSDGCIISGGNVWKSILSPGVIVEREAAVQESVIFDDVIIEPWARIKRTIVDKESRIRAGAQVGYDAEADKKRGCIVSDKGIVVVPKGADLG